MGTQPIPLNATDVDELREQLVVIIRDLYEDRMAGIQVGDVITTQDDDTVFLSTIENGGLEKVNNELGVQTSSTGGIQTTSAGVVAKLKSGGGLGVDSSGLYISSSGYGFGVIDCPAGTDPTADTINDTLQLLVSGSGLTITGNATADSVTFALETGIAAIAGLATTDSNIIVGNGSTWVAESGATARTSLGLGTGDSPSFTTAKLSGLGAGYLPKHTDDATGLQDSILSETAAGIVLNSLSLTLPETTSSTTGVIYQTTNPALHFYHDDHHTIAAGNTFIGINAGNFTMHAEAAYLAAYNTGIGYRALSSITTGGSNLALGQDALRLLTSGAGNTAIGSGACAALTDGQSNVAIGQSAMNVSQSGWQNTAIGLWSLVDGTGCDDNVAIGYYSGRSLTSGDRNTIIGSASGYSMLTGTNSIFLGYKAGYYETDSNILVIDNVVRGANQAAGPPLYLIYGTFAATSAAQTLRFNAAVTVSESLALPDSKQLYLGTGLDAALYYDGTDAHLETDLVAASDLNIDCGTAKTVVLTVPVYRDANVGSLVLQTGGTLPGIVEILDNDGDATGIYTRGFAVNEQGSGTIEIPHDYKEGTNLTFHVHWGGNDAPTGTDNVKWQLKYSISRDDNTFPDSTTIATDDVPYDTRYKWLRSDLPAIAGATGGVDGGSIKIGDQFHFTLTRIAAGGDAFAGEALVATIGIHYQCDTLGSRQIGTK